MDQHAIRANSDRTSVVLRDGKRLFAQQTAQAVEFGRDRRVSTGRRTPMLEVRSHNRHKAVECRTMANFQQTRTPTPTRPGKMLNHRSRLRDNYLRAKAAANEAG